MSTPRHDEVRSLLLTLFTEEWDLRAFAKAILGTTGTAHLPERASVAHLVEVLIIETERRHGGLPPSFSSELLQRFPGRAADITSAIESYKAATTKPARTMGAHPVSPGEGRWKTVAVTSTSLLGIMLLGLLIGPATYLQFKELALQTDASEKDAQTLRQLQVSSTEDYRQQYLTIETLRTDAARREALNYDTISPLNRARLFASIHNCWGPFGLSASENQQLTSCYVLDPVAYRASILQYPLENYPPYEVIPAIVPIPDWRVIDRSHPITESGDLNLDPSGTRSFGVMRLDETSIKLDAQHPPQRIQPLLVDRFEATIAEVEFCAQWGNCGGFAIGTDAKAHHPGQPATSLVFLAATQTCEASSGRVPNSIEWDRIASFRVSSEVRSRFPWGDDYRSELIYFDTGQRGDKSCFDLLGDLYGEIAPVGACWWRARHHNRGQWFEVTDLVGNVWEMVSRVDPSSTDNFVTTKGGSSLLHRPSNEPEAKRRTIVKSPSVSRPLPLPTALSEDGVGLNTSNPNTGFRCVLDVPLRTVHVQATQELPGARAK